VPQQAAHRIGRTAAIVQQCLPVGIGGAIARLLDVLDEGAEQVVQQPDGQLPLLQLVLQRRKNVRPVLRRWLAAGRGVQFAAVGLQLLTSWLRHNATNVQRSWHC
jgi:hypothetical protein